MEDVDALKTEIEELRSKVAELEEKLKKYTIIYI
jgi:polyhydroxyalkanoate synthesis regulator phasin